MMASVSLFISKFKYVSISALLFLLYTSFQISKARKEAKAMISLFDVMSPLIIGVGIMIMYYGRVSPPTDGSYSFWSWTFWLGESTVMSMFALNTIAGKENSSLKPSVPLGIGVFIISTIICLLLRGKFWRYVFVLGFEMGLALVAVMIFPIMEMILEEIMNEKLKKVGNKIRVYSKLVESRGLVQANESETKVSDAASSDLELD